MDRKPNRRDHPFWFSKLNGPDPNRSGRSRPNLRDAWAVGEPASIPACAWRSRFGSPLKHRAATNVIYDIVEFTGRIGETTRRSVGIPFCTIDDLSRTMLSENLLNRDRGCRHASGAGRTRGTSTSRRRPPTLRESVIGAIWVQ